MLHTCLPLSVALTFASPVLADESDGSPETTPAAAASEDGTIPSSVVHSAPARPASPQRPPMSSKERAGLFTAGFVTFGLTYTFTSLAGAIAIDKARSSYTDPLTGETGRRIDARRRAFGRALLVPGAGPFIAMGYTDSARKRWGAAMSGSFQLLAIAMITGAAIAQVRSRRARRFTATAGLHPGGATLGLSGRF